MQISDFEQLDAVVELVVRAVGNNLIGIYQYGSAILGGLRSASDLDVLVVVEQPTTTLDQRRRLVAELLQVSGRRGTRIAGRPVEVTVVRQDCVRPWRAPAEPEFQYGEWLRDEYASGHVPAPVVDSDLAPLLSTALTTSKAIIGPPLGDLIDPIPRRELIASMREGVPALVLELADDTCNVLLTLARMWYSTCTGDVVAKDVAASWVLTRLPSKYRGALAHARAIYLGEQDAAFDQLADGPVETAEFLAAAISRPAPNDSDSMPGQRRG